MSSEFQGLVKSQNIGSITPQQILAAGEPVFLDIQTNADINSINKLIEAYGKIHTPTRGQCIPLTGAINSAVGDETILAPSSNEIRRILAVNVVNAGGAPIVGSVTLGGMVIANFAADPASTTMVELSSAIFASKNLYLAITVASGTVSDLTTNVCSMLVVQ